MYNSSKRQSNLKQTDLLNTTLKRVKKNYNSTEYYQFIHKYPGKATGYNGILLSSIESTAS